MAKRTVRVVAAKKNIQASLFAIDQPAIAAGHQYFASKDYWRNGEFWVKLDNGFSYPVVLFNEVEGRF